MHDEFFHRVFGLDLSQADTPQILAEDGVAAGLPDYIHVQNDTGLRMPVPIVQVLEWIVNADTFSPEVLGGMYCFRIVSNGETRFVFAGKDWGMALLVLFMKTKSSKSHPLPADPIERLKTLREQIRRAGPGYDMTPALNCIEALGITGDLMVECISRTDRYKPPMSIKTLLKIVERQPTSYHGIGDAVSYIDSDGDTVRVTFPKKLSVIISALHERRHAFSLWWSRD